ncbi:hypothetical protein WICMUC_004687 [Wickerhamomyces mucosus]|uniref:RNA helicase n=1 Tax=Wickerhamomyces mucosus TaxID=1378264 RepID=A0A9P8TAJ3_9ASCO|nr:hypothetical protein WICMUC_004687 [Wickerhamomyces mucosus]
MSAQRLHSKFDGGNDLILEVDNQGNLPAEFNADNHKVNTSQRKRSRKRSRGKSQDQQQNPIEVDKKKLEPSEIIQTETKEISKQNGHLKLQNDNNNNNNNKITYNNISKNLRDSRGNSNKLKKPKNFKPKTVDFFSDDEDSNLKDTKGNYIDLKSKAENLLKIRKSLPVYKAKDEIVSRLLKNRVTILIGETGSGKSTQIPQFLLPSNNKCIAVTQPRRVAAINLATRVAEEAGSYLGDKVGYSVRFDNKSTHNTKLKYLTDGMLLREIIIQTNLPQYSTIIIDEAHERTVLTDLLMGFLKELLERRSDLNLIIMSATLDAEKFSKFYNNAEILFVEGKNFKVDRYYLNSSADDIVDTCLKSIIQINNGEQEGDILVFLPGQEEIDKSVGLLERIAPDLPKEAPLIVPLPLYASLSPADQAKVFLPLKARRRKVILATNIAETSVTVPGVRYVIDSGLRKVKVWRHQLGLSTLLTAPISKAAAMQRSGRAGREREGKVFRLYTEDDYLKLPNQTEPEISRSNVISPVLMLKKLGIDDILNWSWLEHPGEDSLISSLTQLYQLKALNDSGTITKLGDDMAILPLEPQLSAILIKAHEFGCLEHVIDIVSCLSVDNLILNPQSDIRDEVNEKRRNLCILGSKHGDLIMLKELFDYYLQFNQISDSKSERAQWCKELALSNRGFKNVFKVRNQIRQYMVTLTKDKHLFEKIEQSDDNDDDDDKINYSKPMDIPSILKSFLSGFISNTAIGMPDRSYRTTTTGQLISVHPSSLIFGEKKDAIMYTDYVYTTKGYARNVSVIELSWLQEMGSHILAPGKVNAVAE